MDPTRILKTGDGSQTLYSERFKASYHSTHGAVAESSYVFLQMGLFQCKKSSIKVFEVGFGSGLNALLTLDAAKKTGLSIEYEAIEAYPIDLNLANKMEFQAFLEDEANSKTFLDLHTSEWEESVEITPDFSLKKIKGDLCSHGLEGSYDVMYMDAFSPNVQAELWTVQMLRKYYDSMAQDGILTTYCCKGQVRRDLLEVGFKVEKLKGPPGKRHMLRAIK